MISKEHITNQLINNGFANAMDITSFLEDGVIFCDHIEASSWLKYCRLIVPHSGYRIEFTHPYKSKNLKDITQYDIFLGDKYIVGSVSSSGILAETQAYIKISQLSTFKAYFDRKYKKSGIMKILGDTRYSENKSNYYRVAFELRDFLKDKSKVRAWKLSKIDI